MNNLLTSSHFKAIVAVTIILLMVFAMMPVQADAATAKYSAGTPGYGVDGKVKIGDGYFWTESNSDYTKSTLYYSAKKSTKSKKVKLASYNNDEYHMDGRILYNGSKVYYATWNLAANGYEFTDSTKVRIHSVSDTGKNRKTVKSIAVKDYAGYITLLKVYNGRLFFSRSGSDPDGNPVDKLCSMSLETKKISTHDKNFPVEPLENNSGSSRYIYGHSFAGGDYIAVFDCTTKKLIRTIEGASRPVAGSSSLIYRVLDWYTGGYTFYKSSLSGKDPQVILELGSNTTIDLCTSSKIYYGEYTDQYRYYVYTIKDGSTKELSESEYGEAVDWY